jgi:hypothetical protein
MRELTCEEIGLVSGGGNAARSRDAAGMSMGMIGLGLRLGAVGVAGAVAFPVAAGVAIGAAVIAAGIAIYWETKKTQQ